PANPQRGEITSARWNSHYLIPPAATFTAPDWVLVTSEGPNPAPALNAVIGRYAFAVYDEGGLMNMNLAGFPTYANITPPAPTSPGQWTITLTCSNGCPPNGTGTLNLTVTGFPFAETTPWPVNLARKGTVAFADLTVLPPNPTSTQINKLMGWRNFATTQQPA